MLDPTSHAGAPALDPRLAAHVIARVKKAHRAADGRPKFDTDTRALRRVFRDLGESYRGYRKRTGEPVSLEVRSAALRFRRDLDLDSLVSVAATLDRLDSGLVV